MAYITAANLNDRYGAPNVAAWANMEGDGSQTTARIATAIAFACDRFDDRMRATPYSNVLPITLVGGGTPKTVVDCVVKLAGYWISTPRGVRDYDKDGNPITPLYADYLEAKSIIEEIASDKLRLDVAK